MFQVSDSDRDDFVYQIVLESTDSNSDFESTESIRSIQAESTGKLLKSPFLK